MQTACVIQVTDENGAPVCELPSPAPRQRVPSPPPNHHANFLLQTSNVGLFQNVLRLMLMAVQSFYLVVSIHKNMCA